MSPDPIEFGDGPNLYKAYYVPNAADPSGTFVVYQEGPDVPGGTGPNKAIGCAGKTKRKDVLFKSNWWYSETSP